MTSYTDNRRYPYPSSAREAGNGGLHSELLARAVAADLDNLDAAWAAEPTKATKIANLSADTGGQGTGSDWTVQMNNVVKSTGPWDSNNPAQMQVSLPGWYYVALNLRTDCTGAITVNAQHVCWVRLVRNNAAGVTATIEERYAATYQPSATAGIYNRVGGMFRMLVGDRIWAAYRHTNTGSTVKVTASGTYLSATRMCGL